MALSDLTVNAVLLAISEFDRLGRDAFLKLHKFGKSRGYFLLHDGKSYDSKAIVGAAHGNIGSGFNPLSASDFSGGDKTVARRLRELGFTVLEPSESKPVGIPFEVGKSCVSVSDRTRLGDGPRAPISWTDIQRAPQSAIADVVVLHSPRSV